MQTILYNISQVIGVAIIHSLWQGLLVFLILRMILLFFGQLSSASKHNVAVAALLSITLWFAYTLSQQVGLYTWVMLKAEKQDLFHDLLAIPLQGGHATIFSPRYYYTIEGFLPYITLLYIAGLLFNTAKLAWARKKIGSIRQSMSIDFQLQLKVEQFVGLLNLRNKVQFGLSKLVDVPCVIGYFKPVILLPFTLSTYLSAEEIEIIILHELAHIKRNDYLINMAQQAMSVVLFFNPFAQLISRTINSERENSCDDIVIEATQKPLVYAHALLKLEQTRQNQWQLALAATGKKYHLLNRIERIMKTQKPVGNTRHILLAIALTTAGITGLAWLNPTIANGKLSFNKVKPAIINNLLTDTAGKKIAKSKNVIAAKKPLQNRKLRVVQNTDGVSDPELDRLSAEVAKHGEAISKYYDSPEFKKMQEQMDQVKMKTEAFDNSPQLKKLQEEMELKGAEFEKMSNSPEMKKMQEQIEKMGDNIGKLYATPQYKNMQQALEDDAVALAKLKQGSPEFKKQNEHLALVAKQLSDYTQSDAMKQQQEELLKMSTAMSNYYASTDFAQKRDEMKVYADSIRKAFQGPQAQLMKDEIARINQQMRTMQNNPQVKKEQELMKQATARMNAYTNSPGFKKRMEKMRKDYSNRDSFEKPERPEKPEKTEQPEAPEKPEVAPAPEAPAPKPVGN